jgi:hypothetical protein
MHRNVGNCSTSYRAIGSPLNIGESRNGKWIQSMDGSFGMSAPQFPNYSTVPYPPSKVKNIIYCDYDSHNLAKPLNLR